MYINCSIFLKKKTLIWTSVHVYVKVSVNVLVDEGCCQDHVSYLMLLAVGGRVRMGIFIQLMLVMTHGGLCH